MKNLNPKENMMRKIIMFLLLVMLLGIPSFAQDSNPDGSIGSFVFTVGGSMGFGTLDENFWGAYEPGDYNRSIYSFLCRVDHPTSRRLTFIVQGEYFKDRVGLSGIYEGKLSTFQIGGYIRFFSE